MEFYHTEKIIVDLVDCLFVHICCLIIGEFIRQYNQRNNKYVKITLREFPFPSCFLQRAQVAAAFPTIPKFMYLYIMENRPAWCVDTYNSDILDICRPRGSWPLHLGLPVFPSFFFSFRRMSRNKAAAVGIIRQ